MRFHGVAFTLIATGLLIALSQLESIHAGRTVSRIAQETGLITYGFPFDPCVTDVSQSRFSLSFESFTDSGNSTGSFCVRVNVDEDGPCSTNTRCCNTNSRKIKFHTGAGCQGSVSGYWIYYPDGGRAYSTAFSWESVGTQRLIKLTPLTLPQASADGTVICLNMRIPCNTLQTFAFYEDTRPSLQYAVYDLKADGYECCPTSSFFLPDSSPSIVSSTPQVPTNAGLNSQPRKTSRNNAGSGKPTPLPRPAPMPVAPQPVPVKITDHSSDTSQRNEMPLKYEFTADPWFRFLPPSPPAWGRRQQ